MRDAQDWVAEFSAPLGQGERMSTAIDNIRAIQRDALEAAAKVLHENYDTARRNHRLHLAFDHFGWADHSNGRLEGIADSIAWVETLIPEAKDTDHAR